MNNTSILLIKKIGVDLPLPIPCMNLTILLLLYKDKILTLNNGKYSL